MLAKQHIPGWAFDPRDTRSEATFSTLDELQKVDWVKRWTDNPHFVRFSRSELHTQRVQQPGNDVSANRHYCNLIAEMPESNEVKHWVVANIYGTLEEIVSLGLSEWVSPPQTDSPTIPSPVLDTPPSVDSLIAGGVLEFVTREPVKPTPVTLTATDALSVKRGDTWKCDPDLGDRDILTVLDVVVEVGTGYSTFITYCDTVDIDWNLVVGHYSTAPLVEFKELLEAKGLGAPSYNTERYCQEFSGE